MFLGSGLSETVVLIQFGTKMKRGQFGTIMKRGQFGTKDNLAPQWNTQYGNIIKSYRERQYLQFKYNAVVCSELFSSPGTALSKLSIIQHMFNNFWQYLVHNNVDLDLELVTTCEPSEKCI